MIDWEYPEIPGKEWLYVGHYTDKYGNKFVKVGTTSDLERRRKEHTRNYRKSPVYPLPADGEFYYDGFIPLSKYNTLRYEDLTRQRWEEAGLGIFVRNDRFLVEEWPEYVEVTIKKTYKFPIERG